MKNLIKLLQVQFDTMCLTGKLFRSNVSGEDLWNAYLKAFLPENNKVFRDPESSEHNCNHCKNFIRRYGDIVAINNDGDLVSMFDVNASEEYDKPMKKLSEMLKTSKIANVFFETFDGLNSLPYEKCNITNSVFALGIPVNYKQYTAVETAKFGVVNDKDVYSFHHFAINIPADFVDKTGKSIAAIMGEYSSNYDVFKRTMEEISVDSLILTRDLINQDSLMNSTKHLSVLNEFIDLRKEYNGKDTWLWIKSYELGGKSKLINSSIGEFIKMVNEGENLDIACLKYNKMVDPTNYMKATAPITEAQKRRFVDEITELGLEQSFIRRLATLDDIKASEILHKDIDKATNTQISIFDGLKTTKSRYKRSEFDRVDEVHIDKFMSDILPTLSGGGIEVYLEPKHSGNLCNITMPVNKDAKNFFKYNSGFNVTFNGNLAGKSEIKEAVKTAGGKVDGVLRFSIMWSGDGVDNSDLDAHCCEPNNIEIDFRSPRSHRTDGNLDIDIRNPLLEMPKGAVENITYPSLNKMVNGTYKFFIHQYASRNSRGFKAEIEFDGELYSYEYNVPVHGNVAVANVTFKNGKFSIEHELPPIEGIGSFSELWSLEPNNFHKVNLVCLSPNYWNDDKVGNKYFMFMLQGAKNPNKVRGFHNEHILPELLQHHKRCLDYFGNVTLCDPIDNQLAGLGFNATVRDELIVKLTGTFKRVIKIKF